MKKITPILLITALILIGLSMSACTKSVEPTDDSDTGPTLEVPPFPLTPTEQGSSLREIVSMTQTASAELTSEPEVVVETATPEEAATEEPVEEETEGEVTEGEETEGEETEGEATEGEEVVTAPVERPETYTLEEGEWIICIARRYDLDLSEYFRINGLTMSSASYGGLLVTLPVEGNWDVEAYGPRALAEHPVDHTVLAGQTVYTIACNYGDVMPEDIIELNNLQEPYTLTAGDILKIP